MLYRPAIKSYMGISIKMHMGNLIEGTGKCSHVDYHGRNIHIQIYVQICMVFSSRETCSFGNKADKQKIKNFYAILGGTVLMDKITIVSSSTPRVYLHTYNRTLEEFRF